MQKPEAEALAKATAEVAKYYPMAIDGKTIAWVNLATCIGLTYGPRVYMVRQRLDAERAQRTRSRQTAPTPAAETAANATENATGFSAGFIMPGSPGAMGPVDSAGTF